MGQLLRETYGEVYKSNGAVVTSTWFVLRVYLDGQNTDPNNPQSYISAQTEVGKEPRIFSFLE